MLYDSHLNAKSCSQSAAHLLNCVCVAEQRGLGGLVVTVHRPLPKRCADWRTSIGDFSEVLNVVDWTRRACAGRVDVRLGLEIDYCPGYEEWVRHHVRGAVFDYVQGTVDAQHCAVRATGARDNAREVQRRYLQLQEAAAETGLFDCLGIAESWLDPQ